jgi:hypothetical protein
MGGMYDHVRGDELIVEQGKVQEEMALGIVLDDSRGTYSSPILEIYNFISTTTIEIIKYPNKSSYPENIC